MPSDGTFLTFIYGGSGENQSPMLQRRFFRFIGHELVAIFSSLFGALFLLIRLEEASTAHQQSLLFHLIHSQYSPAFWFFPLFIGFTINYHTRHRSACWLGAINLALFVGLTFVEVLSMSAYDLKLSGGHPWQYTYCELFAIYDGICGAGSAARFLITGPVLGTIA
jgi:hypothetical protein